MRANCGAGARRLGHGAGGVEPQAAALRACAWRAGPLADEVARLVGHLCNPADRTRRVPCSRAPRPPLEAMVWRVRGATSVLDAAWGRLGCRHGCAPPVRPCRSFPARSATDVHLVGSHGAPEWPGDSAVHQPEAQTPGHQDHEPIRSRPDRRPRAATGSAAVYELRSVAVLFGNCIEPSKVKAGGKAGRIRFACAGGSFCRLDPSYLPVIEEHINPLRAGKETAAAMDAEELVVSNLADQASAFGAIAQSLRDCLSPSTSSNPGTSCASTRASSSPACPDVSASPSARARWPTPPTPAPPPGSRTSPPGRRPSTPPGRAEAKTNGARRRPARC